MSSTVPYSNDGPVMPGQEIEPDTGIATPYETWSASDGKYQGTALAEITPLNSQESRIKTIVVDAAALNSFHLVYALLQPIQLPDRLLALKVYWNSNKGDGYAWAAPTNVVDGGGNVETRTTVSAHASATVDGDIWTDIDEGYQDSVPATYHMFFLENNNVLMPTILAKLSAKLGTTVLVKPVVKPSSYTFIAFGQSSDLRITRTGFQSYGAGIIGIIQGELARSVDRSVGLSSSTLHIPPTLHGPIAIQEVNNAHIVATATASSVRFIGDTPTDVLTVDAVAQGTYSSSVIPATTPTSYPTGTFLWDFQAKPYKPGWSQITAVTVPILPAYI